MIVLRWIVPLGPISTWTLLLFGVGFMVFGIVIAIGAEAQFKQNRTTVDHLGLPAKLVTDGWFKYSRNPMYLSFVFMLLGAWLVLGTFLPLLGIVAYVFLTERWYIAPEEERLIARFGKQYESFWVRTRRWL
jgi:protein-S-isoprenylcysteine O-methyltransferase Ste14